MISITIWSCHAETQQICDVLRRHLSQHVHLPTHRSGHFLYWIRTIQSDNLISGVEVIVTLTAKVRSARSEFLHEPQKASEGENSGF